MAEDSQEDRIKKLWHQWITSTATAEEVTELFDLLRDDGQRGDMPGLLPPEPEYPLTDRMSDETKERILGAALGPLNAKKRRIRIIQFAAAASILLIVGAAAVYQRSPARQPELANNVTNIQKADVLPGRDRALLTLADGSTIQVDSVHAGFLATQGTTKIVKTGDGRLAYAATPKDGGGELLSNTMSTPRGGQYRLQLPDGTKVWLNAASAITFPAAFAKNVREVKITGEVYFEVAPDASRPFIVKTPAEDLKVLGTSFNVNAYADEAGMRTSLVHGSLLVGTKKLAPGNICVNDRVFNGDVNIDIAWKDGSFAFNNTDLRSLMRQLARWYDLNIVYAQNVQSAKFTGEIGRDLTLDQLLKGLAITKIKYRLEGQNTLIIY